MLETRLVAPEPGAEHWKHGYFLSMDELERLCRDHLVDNHDGFVSNTRAYIEAWLKKNDEPRKRSE